MKTASRTRDAGEIAVAFTRVLRGAGLTVPTSSTIAFGEAIACVGLDDRESTYWAGRATLIRRPEDADLYDRAFRVFWEQAVARGDSIEDEPLHVTLAIDAETHHADLVADVDGPRHHVSRLRMRMETIRP